MRIKGLLGFCECAGCFKRARKKIVVKNLKNDEYIKLKVCEDCLFKF